MARSYCNTDQVKQYLPPNVVTEGSNPNPNFRNPAPETASNVNLDFFIQQASAQIDANLVTAKAYTDTANSYQTLYTNTVVSANAISANVIISSAASFANGAFDKANSAASFANGEIGRAHV